MLDSNDGAMAGYDKMVNDQLAFLVSKQGGIGLAESMVNQMMAQIKNKSWTESMSGTSESGNAQ